jgi:hypothetical protein
MARVQQRQLQEIAEACQQDLEMQLLVLAYIAEVKAEREGKTKKGPKKSGSQASLALAGDKDGLDGPGFDIDEATQLSGKQLKLSAWRKGLIRELLAYCEPGAFGMHRCHVDSLQRCSACWRWAGMWR